MKDRDRIKERIKERMQVLEDLSINRGCELKYDEGQLYMARRDELWDLKDFIMRLEWEEIQDKLKQD